MYRKKKFRGRSLDNNEWIYGSLTTIESEQKCMINNVLVDPVTVHQYLPERSYMNDQDIYEGDIIRMTRAKHKSDHLFMAIAVSEEVVIEDGFGRWLRPQDCYDYTVVGNVVENLDLLSEKGQKWVKNYMHDPYWWK